MLVLMVRSKTGEIRLLDPGTEDRPTISLWYRFSGVVAARVPEINTVVYNLMVGG